MYRILAILILVSVTCLVGVGGDSTDNVYITGLQVNGLDEQIVTETVSGMQIGDTSRITNVLDPVSN